MPAGTDATHLGRTQDPDQESLFQTFSVRQAQTPDADRLARPTSRPAIVGRARWSAVALAVAVVTVGVAYAQGVVATSTSTSTEYAKRRAQAGPPSVGLVDSQGSSALAVASLNAPGVVLDGRRMGGWYAGAAGTGVADGRFARWLRQPVTIAGMWADSTEEIQRTVSTLEEFTQWDGALDIAVGGTVLGSSENYAAAAAGAYDARWRRAARTIAAARRRATGPTFVRPFHEMNGTWYRNWTVTKANSADYKLAFARYVRILRAEFPQVYIAFSPNSDDHTGLPISSWYPGDDVVDVVAPDYYDDTPSLARYSVTAWNAEVDDVDELGNPTRPQSWLKFAAHHGKPIAFPEWGLKPAGTGVDHPEWIRAFNAWLVKNENTAQWQIGQKIPRAAAGKVLYSVYFNVDFRGNSAFTIYGHGANPKASSMFARLRWGRPITSP